MYDVELSRKCFACELVEDCTGKCVRGYSYDDSDEVIGEWIEQRRQDFREGFMEYAAEYSDGNFF